MRQRHNLAVEIVPMVVIVMVDRQFPRSARAEKRHIGGIAADVLRMAGTADVAVQADDPLRRRHAQMQVVRYQEHAAAAPVANARENAVESSEERRVGKECVGKCRSRWVHCRTKKKTKIKTK